MIHKAKHLGIFSCVLLLAILVIPAAYADTKNTQNMCKEMYPHYKELGEKKFLEKYRSKSSVYACIKLYENPNWTFAGKNKIDRNYENLALLTQNKAAKSADVAISSSINVGDGKFLVKFRACTDTTFQNPSFLIKSKMDQYIGLSKMMLEKGKCIDYQVYVQAKYRQDITITHILDTSKYSDAGTRSLRI